MPSKNRFPKTDAEFSLYIGIAIPYLNANKARLLVTTTANAQLTAVTTLYSAASTGWTTVYLLSQNSSTATGSITATKTALRAQITSALRIIYDDIPRSLLTQVDRDTLHLAAPSSSHTAASVPQEVPVINVSQRSHLSVTLTIVDQSRAHSLAKPKGVGAIQIEGAFLPHTQSVSQDFPQDSDFRHLATSGRSSFTRAYVHEQLRGTEYFRARYLNSRNEPGGWSEIIQVVVS